MLYNIDFKNKKLIHKTDVILTEQMIRDVAYFLHKDKLPIKAISIWQYFLNESKIDLDIHEIQNKLDSLEKNGTVLKEWDTTTFKGYLYKGRHIDGNNKIV